MNAAGFCSLLQQLSVPDNAVRNAAEQQYNALLANNPIDCLMWMLEIYNQPDVPSYLKQLSIVLFRRLTITPETSLLPSLNRDKYVVYIFYNVHSIT
jgi:hypothetical protein